MRLSNLLVLMALLFTAACAPSLSMYEKIPKPQTHHALISSKPLNKNITAGDIVADNDVRGMTPIDSEQYKQSVIFSLRQAGWYADQNSAQYVLDAHLLKVDQPFVGFDMTVKTTAEYTLKKKASNKVVYHDTLTLPCTTRFAEAFNGEVRLRMATACSVGENTTHFLKVLNSKY